MNDWDWLLLALAGYVAVMGLVRMMRARERELVDELRLEFERQSASQSHDQGQAQAA
ncbi:MAG: hypothetical protein R3B96_25730 [Pirellulaceae bacterium]|nr:hypothetical protein [Planctomycetales bacterium]